MSHLEEYNYSSSLMGTYKMKCPYYRKYISVLVFNSARPDVPWCYGDRDSNSVDSL
jgi:hypothetical protein